MKTNAKSYSYDVSVATVYNYTQIKFEKYLK